MRKVPPSARELPSGTSLWLVLRVARFEDSILVGGQAPVVDPHSGGPDYFCPVFINREDAVKWADGDEDRVLEISRS